MVRRKAVGDKIQVRRLEMAKNEIACSISTLGSDISTIKTQHSALVKAAEALKQSVNSLNGMWAGPAHDTFASAFSGDYEVIKGMCDTIGEIVKSLDNAKKEYAKCENHVNSYVASITV